MDVNIGAYRELGGDADLKFHTVTVH